MNGLELYSDAYLKIRFKASLLKKIRRLESLARNPSRSGEMLLLEMESFLRATSEGPEDFVCFRRSLGNETIAATFQKFLAGDSDRSKIFTLKELIEDADVFSIGALRSITAIARLFDPMHWGTLNWRVLACAGFDSMTELKGRRIGQNPQQVKAEFAQMSEASVFRYLDFIRKQVRAELPNLPRVVGALYCLSLDLWPLEIPIEKPTSLPIFHRVRERRHHVE